MFGAEVVAVDGPETAADAGLRLDRRRDRRRRRPRRDLAARRRSPRPATPSAPSELRAPAAARARHHADAASSPGRSPCRPPTRSPTGWSPSTRVTGEQLRARDLLRNATGTASIFNPNPVVQQGSYSGLKDKNDKDYSRLTAAAAAGHARAADEHQGLPQGHLRRRPGERAGKKVCEPRRRLHRPDPLGRRLRGGDGLLPHRPHARLRRQPRAVAAAAPKPQKVFANAIPDDNSFYSSTTTSWCSAPAGSTTARTPT